MGKLKTWAPQQDQIIRHITSSIKSKRWKKASEQLKKHGFERNEIECRQRFINHLDPKINKQFWTDQELKLLYSKFNQYGNKWFQIQKYLSGRTQTKIKNYFYGNLRLMLKIIVKYFFQQNTGFVNDIKTQTLLEMFQAKNQFKPYDIVAKTIKRLGYRVEKCTCQNIISENQKLFYSFIVFFLQNYTQNTKTTNEEIFQESFEPKQIPLTLKCQPKPFTPVSIISMVNGETVSSTMQECQHLKSMALMHLKWYQHYQNAYLSQLQKIQQQ